MVVVVVVVAVAVGGDGRWEREVLAASSSSSCSSVSHVFAGLLTNDWVGRSFFLVGAVVVRSRKGITHSLQPAVDAVIIISRGCGRRGRWSSEPLLLFFGVAILFSSLFCFFFQATVTISPPRLTFWRSRYLAHFSPLPFLPEWEEERKTFFPSSSVCRSEAADVSDPDLRPPDSPFFFLLLLFLVPVTRSRLHRRRARVKVAGELIRQQGPTKEKCRGEVEIFRLGSLVTVQGIAVQNSVFLLN